MKLLVNKTLSNLFYVLALFYFLTSCTYSKKDYFEGVLLEDCKIIWFTNINHGKCTIYYQNRTINGIISYRFNKLHGQALVFFENGNLRHRIEFKNDRLWNIFEYYDIDGNVLDYGDFVDGNGFLKIYSNYGELRSSGNVVDGLQHGKWNLYSNRGLTATTNYNHGKRSGNDFVNNVFFR